MPRATVSLELSGPELTLEESERLANFLRQALAMVPGGNVKIEVGHVTYDNPATTEVQQ